jgi:hypothetical protein
LLTDGLSFEWLDLPPPPYFEPNNKSALVHMDILQATVDTWCTAGFVELVARRPHCCNPLTVAVQYNAVTDTVKHRPCIDLSRHVNSYIQHLPAKLDDLTVAQQLIAPGDWTTSFDLENQFFRLNRQCVISCGFPCRMPPAAPTTTASVMPYGCKPAVSVVTRLLKPVKSFLHRLGIKFSIYVDNGRISAADFRAFFVLHILHLAGWRVQWKKTYITPTQSLLHLGFVTDTIAMTYSITTDKWLAFVQLAES